VSRLDGKTLAATLLMLSVFACAAFGASTLWPMRPLTAA